MIRKSICILLAVFCGHAAYPQLYKDPKAPVKDRVEDLLGRMTLEEK